MTLWIQTQEQFSSASSTVQFLFGLQGLPVQPFDNRAAAGNNFPLETFILLQSY